MEEIQNFAWEHSGSLYERSPPNMAKVNRPLTTVSVGCAELIGPAVNLNIQYERICFQSILESSNKVHMCRIESTGSCMDSVLRASCLKHFCPKTRN